MPKYQGEYDGLCGPYAIANAFECCGILKTKKLFKICCEAPARRRWPEILWEGTGFGDLQRTIKSCVNSERNNKNIKVSYPFLKKTPKTNDEYHQRLDKISRNEEFLAGIIRRTKPSHHWIVFEKHGKLLEFTDTEPHSLTKRKRQSSVFAGKGGPKNAWRVKLDELVVFADGKKLSG